LPTVRAANPLSFTFTAAGDYGGITTGSNGWKVANGTKGVNPSFHIALGDLGYGDQSPTHWCSSFKTLYPNLVLVTGNHDTWNGGSVSYLDGSTGFANDTLTSDVPAPHGFLDTSSGYVSACGAPSGINWFGSNVTYGGGTCNASPVFTNPSCYGREYYFDYPTSNPIMRFIFISAGMGGSWADYTASPPTAHYLWLKARIDEAKNAGLWVAVVTHKNCISDDSDLPDCASTFDPFNLAVTEKLGVDLWLDGHSHTYQRSNQLSNVANACTKYGNNTVSCQVAHAGNQFTKGQGTIVNIIGTGGEMEDPICTGSCPRNTQFAKLCGSNGDISYPQTAGCNNDYGFSQFQVSNNNITATYVSATGTFTDTYVIKVPNPPGDFSVSAAPPASFPPGPGNALMGPLSLANPLPISRGVLGSSSTVIVDSFGGFSSPVTLSGTVSGGGACPGSNCPRVVFNLTSVTPPSGGTESSRFNINSTATNQIQCGNPNSTGPVFTVTVTATSGSTTHQTSFNLYVYGNPDITKNGIVNIFDLTFVGGEFGATPSSGNWSPDADLNNDGKINIFDLTGVGGQFGGSGC